MELSEKELAQAVKTLDTMCAAFDEAEYKYSRVDEKFSVLLKFEGDDFPIDVVFRVFPDMKFVAAYSQLSFNIPENGRTNVAVALTMVNERIYDGVWTENLATGEVQFRVTNSYQESILGKECFRAMLRLVISFTNDLADKLFMVGKGNMSLQQFYDSVFNDD